MARRNCYVAGGVASGAVVLPARSPWPRFRWNRNSRAVCAVAALVLVVDRVRMSPPGHGHHNNIQDCLEISRSGRETSARHSPSFCSGSASSGISHTLQSKRCMHQYFGRRPAHTVAAASPDRATALQTLGLDVSGFSEPSSTEVRRAFRREALKWHPDQEGGDAARFQQIKEAYELLSGRTEVGISFSGMPSGKAPKPWPQPVQEDAAPPDFGGPFALPLALGIALVLGVVLSSSTSPPENVVIVSNQGGTIPQRFKRLQIETLRGLEYVNAASAAAEVEGTPLVFLEQIAERDVSATGQLVRVLRAALDEHRPATPIEEAAFDDETTTAANAAGQQLQVPIYNYVTAVVREESMDSLINVLRTDQSFRFEGIRREFMSGRVLAELDREATGQRLLLVGARDIFRPADDFLTDLRATLAGRNPLARLAERGPDIIVFDLTKAEWSNLSKQYEAGAGQIPWRDVPVLSPADLGVN